MTWRGTAVVEHLRRIGRLAGAPVRPRTIRVMIWMSVLLGSSAAPREEPRAVGSERRAGRTGRIPHTAELRRASRVANDTYIADILAEETVLRRWRVDVQDTVRVWLSYGGQSGRVRSWDRYAVRDAFHAWNVTGVPVHFSFVADSAWAQVHVVWRDQLPDGRAGQVTRMPDANGWLHGALLELATRTAQGRRFDPATRRAVALHEVGHVLGLEHSSDSTDIMAAWVHSRALSARDRATVRLVYGMPAEPAADSASLAGVTGGSGPAVDSSAAPGWTRGAVVP